MKEYSITHPIDIRSFKTIGEAILDAATGKIQRWLLKKLLPKECFDDAEVVYFIAEIEKGTIINSLSIDLDLGVDMSVDCNLPTSWKEVY